MKIRARIDNETYHKLVDLAVADNKPLEEVAGEMLTIMTRCFKPADIDRLKEIDQEYRDRPGNLQPPSRG